MLAARAALGRAVSVRRRAASSDAISFVSCVSLALMRSRRASVAFTSRFVLREARRALALERAQPFLLAPLVAAILLERVLQREKSVALLLDLVAQLLDAADQRAVAQREQVEILVARDQLAERSRGQHRLRREQRAALVDVDQPASQRILLLPSSFSVAETFADAPFTSVEIDASWRSSVWTMRDVASARRSRFVTSSLRSWTVVCNSAARRSSSSRSRRMRSSVSRCARIRRPVRCGSGKRARNGDGAKRAPGGAAEHAAAPHPPSRVRPSRSYAAEDAVPPTPRCPSAHQRAEHDADERHAPIEERRLEMQILLERRASRATSARARAFRRGRP